MSIKYTNSAQCSELLIRILCCFSLVMLTAESSRANNHFVSSRSNHQGNAAQCVMIVPTLGGSTGIGKRSQILKTSAKNAPAW